MSGPAHWLCNAVAVLVGLSPLLWVTAREYRTQAAAYHSLEQRVTLLERGQRLLGAGAIDEAVALLRGAALAHPDDPDVRYALGVALMRAGRFDESRQELREVLRLREERVDAAGALPP